MLDLNSPDWKELGTFFGHAETLPGKLRLWQAAIGTESERDLWREIFDLIWHQNTIESACFAVVPHFVEQIGKLSEKRKIESVIDLGFIESARREWSNEDIPPHLLDSYNASISNSRKYAVECLGLASDKIEFRYIFGAVGSLYGHRILADFLFNLDCIGDACPKCGGFVYPSEIQESDYI